MFFVCGFVFTRTFSFVSLNKTNTEYQHIILTSLIPGYILVNAYKLIPNSLSKNSNIVLCVLICFILGYVTSKIYISSFFENILSILGIHRSVNNGIWSDINSGGRPIWIHARMNSQNEAVYGEVKFLEINSRYPIIFLKRYEICNLSGDIIKDISDDRSRGYVLDTSKCDRIEVAYADVDEKGNPINWKEVNHSENIISVAVKNMRNLFSYCQKRG